MKTSEYLPVPPGDEAYVRLVPAIVGGIYTDSYQRQTILFRLQ
ncbi:MAG TPA: hypothetical protein VL727_24640 [Puia sp.]|nr:hypothetical protein [Puia sp.]